MPAGTKRKRTAKKSGSASRKDGSISKKSRIDLHERQYFQGLSGSDFGPWFGCGSSLLQTPSFTFQSPVDGLMRFEIDSGENPEGPGGGLRLYVPCDNLKDVVDEPTFMVPFQHVEQFIIIDEPGAKNSAPSTNPAYRAIMIPTAAVGASILRRAYPKVISFALPDQKAGTDFKGKIGEGVDDPDETYHSLVTRVFNEHLAPFSKSVIDASSAATAEESHVQFTCDAVFKQESDAPQKPVNGKLFFLETGIFFHSQTAVLYLTAESTPTTMLVSNYEIASKRPGPVNLTLVCPTSEPYYEKGPESQQGMSKEHKSNDPLFISFHDIAVNMFDKILQYAERCGIDVNEVDQEWYSLKKNEPMTGWDPPGMRPRRY